MAESKIKMISIHRLNGSNSTTIPYRQQSDVTDISIPAGTWLVISLMWLSNAGNGVYNHVLGSSIVRSPETNGGGSINSIVINGPVTIPVKCYHNITDGTIVSDSWNAIKIQ